MAQYPPGGFAPPPPGGFAPPPPPMYGSGGQPPKSPKTGFIALIGCAGVLVVVVGVIVAGAMFWSTSASSTGPAPVAAGPAVAAPGGTCSKTADCCRKIVQASGGDPSALKSCDNFLQLADTNCSAALEGYKKSATLLKVQCD
ncbi:MAG: hypothetical protein H6716_21835 [Polyangiaceae bacterium]|nr:hypothetical protein [Polyangiaceae bacterium]